MVILAVWQILLYLSDLKSPPILILRGHCESILAIPHQSDKLNIRQSVFTKFNVHQMYRSYGMHAL